uniref:Uncharacterized protein n=1 Tax=Rhizophora mucronata TaxID=61149 RepID=A0A2P2Q0B6_RHIMU
MFKKLRLPSHTLNTIGTCFHVLKLQQAIPVFHRILYIFLSWWATCFCFTSV